MQTNATVGIVTLSAPWPAGLARLSPAAARAVRSSIAWSGNGSSTGAVTFAAPAAEWRRLLAASEARATLETPDASAYYEARADRESAAIPAASANEAMRVAGRRLLSSEPALAGSMGGYYTSSELALEMSRLVSRYPSLISTPIRMGTSRLGRAIEVWCVTDGLVSCSGGGDRPAVLYTALVHAREPATLMCLVHALREVLRDAEMNVGGAANLLRTRKLLFMPLANPDGYAWNERTRPRGGGMKRKNGAQTCQPPDTENDGVDLNRNFGFKYAYDNVGSSPSGCSEEYRGTSAFSEPETQAIREVVRRHAPKIVLHWHGWGNDIAFPFSFDWHAPMSNSDLGMFQEFANEMAANNHYASGRAWESVGYTTNGEADDWGWGDQRAASLTIEVGSSQDGFWPPPSRILPIAMESAFPARYAAWAAGPMMQLDGLVTTSNDEGTAGSFTLTVQNNGLGHYTHVHRMCAHGTPATATLQSSARWETPAGEDSASRACVSVPALEARTSTELPALSLSWPKAAKWVSLTLTSEGGTSSSHTETFQIKVHNSATTLKSCDSLCLCTSADTALLDYSHECRAAVPPGSHCAVAKPAHTGANWASGVLDEHFKYTATQYSRGGRCTVSSLKRDTLVAVYAICARFGAQDPLGFANSEGGRTATVSFPCTAGTNYYIFWNAEYMPGRFSFTINEACGGADCTRAHRLRHLMRMRHKQRRSK